MRQPKDRQTRDQRIERRISAASSIAMCVLTVLIRSLGSYPEGVSYAILCMNCCCVLLDRVGRPTPFGAPGKGGAGK